MKYRKIPVIIEAIQWNGYNLNEIIDFTGLRPSAHKRLIKNDGLKIFTIEGKIMHADINDFIIKGIHGEFYPCKPDIFELTYDEVLW